MSVCMYAFVCACVSSLCVCEEERVCVGVIICVEALDPHMTCMSPGTATRTYVICLVGVLILGLFRTKLSRLRKTGNTSQKLIG